MKVLVTGAGGFIGRNLIERLKYFNSVEIFEYDKTTKKELLDQYCQECDFVYHLAGVNRPLELSEFHVGNLGFTSELLDHLKRYGNHCPIMLSSSIQAELDNPYGQSKKEGEELLEQFGKQYKSQTFIYRFPNVFGKWCRPNYNSAVSTFCHNIAHGLPIKVNDRDTKLSLVYIDDVIDELLNALKGNANIRADGFCYVQKVHSATLGEIVDLLHSFKESRNTLVLPNMEEESFSKKLYSTYISYLPTDSFKYPLKMNTDDRGSFTELFRTIGNGQVSINISKAGVEKGNHWHNTKNEKFIVVSGEALIQFRKLNSIEIISYHVSGEKMEIVDIPVGYTHNILNVGYTDLITVMWCNECFNPDNPDTYFLKVNQ